MQSTDSRGLMLKLRDVNTKQDMQSACRTLRPADLYANDDLTPTRANLLYLLRRAESKSNGRIVACGSLNGTVYALFSPLSDSARKQKVFINTMDRLESLCERELGVSIVDDLRTCVASG